LLVIPAKAGIQRLFVAVHCFHASLGDGGLFQSEELDSGFRRNDELKASDIGYLA
jgi:hypothetical protein